MIRVIAISLSVLVLTACDKTKDNFTITAVPGTDTSQALPLFRKLVDHCPGIYKYKDDVERVEYGLDGGFTNFRVIIKERTTVIPVEARAFGHTCHFSVDESKTVVGKRPCAWFCTGQDMTGIDGEDHSYAKGRLLK